MAFDLAIKNGRIFDGTGNPFFKADIYVNKGKISKISRSAKDKAEIVIYAEGLAVAPGFIDIHQHSDFTLFANPLCESFIRQGVTTVSTGNCGLSLAPLSDEYKKDIVRYNETFSFGQKIPYNWASFGEYLDKLEEADVGINIWPQIGHCTLKASVMGYEGRKANKRELKEMKSVLKDAIKDGARGLSAGWYAPAYWSDSNELIELAKLASKYGNIFTIHLRERGVDEAVEIGKNTGIPVEIAHYNGIGVEDARKNGIDVTYDAYPYRTGFSFLGQTLPFWVYEGGTDSMLERIEDKRVIDKIKREKSNFDFSNVGIAFLPDKDSKIYEGRNVEEIVKEEKMEPIEFVCEQLYKNKGAGLYKSINWRTEDDVIKLFKDPNSFIASDGWGLATHEPLNIGKPHPRFYGTFPRVLGRYVRDSNVLSLQEAIRKMTLGPAQKMGINDRGVIRENMYADITIFDQDIIGDKATYENPHQYSTGIRYVILNGEIVISEDEHTGAREGKILRRSNKSYG